MTERPILFSGPMVRAILEGRKTQTRRVLNPQPTEHRYEGNDITYFKWKMPQGACGYPESVLKAKATRLDGFPYQVGDVLYVREAWRPIGGGSGSTCMKPEDVDFRASPPRGDEIEADVWDSMYPWKPSIHLPKAFSRIRLTVTDVRVQRLQDISEEDAKAEGVFLDSERPEEHDYTRNKWMCPKCAGTGLHNGFGPSLGVIFDIDCTRCDTAKKKYKHLWNSINEKRGHGWDVNPWVAAITFKQRSER